MQSRIKRINYVIKYNPLRKKADDFLADFSKSEISSDKIILVDGFWDNPNYWLRYSLIRKSLGFANGKEIGTIGPYNRKRQEKTFKRFGIPALYDFLKIKEFSSKSYDITKELFALLKEPGDILKWNLPFGIKPELLYDYILKKQKAAYVKIDDPGLLELVAQYVNYLFVSDKIIRDCKPDIFVSSHAIGINAPLVWLALKNDIPVIVPYGNVGTCRFWKIRNTGEIFNFMDRLRIGSLSEISDEKKDTLEKIGNDYLESRMSGKTNNLGARYAYNTKSGNVSKSLVCEESGWDPAKKIIAVYASSWYDFPHTHGMSYFRDFYDWITATLEKARKNKNVNWIFKAHPIDEWYGGITLSDIVNLTGYENIRLADKKWSGKLLLNSLDGVITYHGTVGLEATTLKIPVLVADEGWYTDWKFVKVPRNRDDYLQLLSKNWWEGMDMNESSRSAKIFTGLYWGKPAWQKNFLLDDDSVQWDIYKKIPALFLNNEDVLEKELENIKKWYESSATHYHAYKIIHAEEVLEI